MPPQMSQRTPLTLGFSGHVWGRRYEMWCDPVLYTFLGLILHICKMGPHGHPALPCSEVRGCCYC